MQLNIFFFMWADDYKSFVLTCYKCTRYFCLFYFDKDIYNLRATKRHAAEIERIKAHDTDTGVNTQTSVQWHWYTLKRETTRACILLKYADICATLLGITENLYHNVKKYVTSHFLIETYIYVWIYLEITLFFSLTAFYKFVISKLFNCTLKKLK